MQTNKKNKLLFLILAGLSLAVFFISSLLMNFAPAIKSAVATNSDGQQQNPSPATILLTVQKSDGEYVDSNGNKLYYNETYGVIYCDVPGTGHEALIIENGSKTLIEGVSFYAKFVDGHYENKIEGLTAADIHEFSDTKTDVNGNPIFYYTKQGEQTLYVYSDRQTPIGRKYYAGVDENGAYINELTGLDTSELVEFKYSNSNHAIKMIQAQLNDGDVYMVNDVKRDGSLSNNIVYTNKNTDSELVIVDDTLRVGDLIVPEDSNIYSDGKYYFFYHLASETSGYVEILDPVFEAGTDKIVKFTKSSDGTEVAVFDAGAAQVEKVYINVNFLTVDKGIKTQENPTGKVYDIKSAAGVEGTLVSGTYYTTDKNCANYLHFRTAAESPVYIYNDKGAQTQKSDTTLSGIYVNGNYYQVFEDDSRHWYFDGVSTKLVTTGEFYIARTNTSSEFAVAEKIANPTQKGTILDGTSIKELTENSSWQFLLNGDEWASLEASAGSVTYGVQTYAYTHRLSTAGGYRYFYLGESNGTDLKYTEVFTYQQRSSQNSNVFSKYYYVQNTNNVFVPDSAVFDLDLEITGTGKLSTTSSVNFGKQFDNKFESNNVNTNAVPGTIFNRIENVYYFNFNEIEGTTFANFYNDLYYTENGTDYGVSTHVLNSNGNATSNPDYYNSKYIYYYAVGNTYYVVPSEFVGEYKYYYINEEDGSKWVGVKASAVIHVEHYYMNDAKRVYITKDISVPYEIEINNEPRAGISTLTTEKNANYDDNKDKIKAVSQNQGFKLNFSVAEFGNKIYAPSPINVYLYKDGNSTPYYTQTLEGTSVSGYYLNYELSGDDIYGTWEIVVADQENQGYYVDVNGSGKLIQTTKVKITLIKESDYYTTDKMPRMENASAIDTNIQVENYFSTEHLADDLPYITFNTTKFSLDVKFTPSGLANSTTYSIYRTNGSTINIKKGSEVKTYTLSEYILDDNEQPISNSLSSEFRFYLTELGYYEFTYKPILKNTNGTYEDLVLSNSSSYQDHFNLTYFGYQLQYTQYVAGGTANRENFFAYAGNLNTSGSEFAASGILTLDDLFAGSKNQEVTLSSEITLTAEQISILNGDSSSDVEELFSGLTGVISTNQAPATFINSFSGKLISSESFCWFKSNTSSENEWTKTTLRSTDFFSKAGSYIIVATYSPLNADITAIISPETSFTQCFAFEITNSQAEYTVKTIYQIYNDNGTYQLFDGTTWQNLTQITQHYQYFSDSIYIDAANEIYYKAANNSFAEEGSTALTLVGTKADDAEAGSIYFDGSNYWWRRYNATSLANEWVALSHITSHYTYFDTENHYVYINETEESYYLAADSTFSKSNAITLYTTAHKNENVENGRITNGNVIIEISKAASQFDVKPQISIKYSDLNYAKQDSGYILYNLTSKNNNFGVSFKDGEFNGNYILDCSQIIFSSSRYFEITLYYGPNVWGQKETYISWNFTIDNNKITFVPRSMNNEASGLADNVYIIGGEGNYFKLEFGNEYSQKTSGALVSAGYYYTPIVKDDSLETTPYNGNNKIYMATHYKLAIDQKSEFIAYSRNTQIRCSNPGLYEFVITDEAGNTASYFIFLDNVSPEYIERDLSQGANEDTTAPRYTLIWGDFKAILIEGDIAPTKNSKNHSGGKLSPSGIMTSFTIDNVTRNYLFSAISNFQIKFYPNGSIAENNAVSQGYPKYNGDYTFTQNSLNAQGQRNYSFSAQQAIQEGYSNYIQISTSGYTVLKTKRNEGRFNAYVTDSFGNVGGTYSVDFSFDLSQATIYIRNSEGAQANLINNDSTNFEELFVSAKTEGSTNYGDWKLEYIKVDFYELLYTGDLYATSPETITIFSETINNLSINVGSNNELIKIINEVNGITKNGKYVITRKYDDNFHPTPDLFEAKLYSNNYAIRTSGVYYKLNDTWYKTDLTAINPGIESELISAIETHLIPTGATRTVDGNEYVVYEREFVSDDGINYYYRNSNLVTTDGVHYHYEDETIPATSMPSIFGTQKKGIDTDEILKTWTVYFDRIKPIDESATYGQNRYVGDENNLNLQPSSENLQFKEFVFDGKTICLDTNLLPIIVDLISDKYNLAENPYSFFNLFITLEKKNADGAWAPYNNHKDELVSEFLTAGEILSEGLYRITLRDNVGSTIIINKNRSTPNQVSFVFKATKRAPEAEFKTDFDQNVEGSGSTLTFDDKTEFVSVKPETSVYFIIDDPIDFYQAKVDSTKIKLVYKDGTIEYLTENTAFSLVKIPLTNQNNYPAGTTRYRYVVECTQNTENVLGFTIQFKGEESDYAGYFKNTYVCVFDGTLPTSNIDVLISEDADNGNYINGAGMNKNVQEDRNFKDYPFSMDATEKFNIATSVASKDGVNFNELIQSLFSNTHYYYTDANGNTTYFIIDKTNSNKRYITDEFYYSTGDTLTVVPSKENATVNSIFINDAAGTIEWFSPNNRWIVLTSEYEGKLATLDTYKIFIREVSASGDFSKPSILPGDAGQDSPTAAIFSGIDGGHYHEFAYGSTISAAANLFSQAEGYHIFEIIEKDAAGNFQSYYVFYTPWASKITVSASYKNYFTAYGNTSTNLISHNETLVSGKEINAVSDLEITSINSLNKYLILEFAGQTYYFTANDSINDIIAEQASNEGAYRLSIYDKKDSGYFVLDINIAGAELTMVQDEFSLNEIIINYNTYTYNNSLKVARFKNPGTGIVKENRNYDDGNPAIPFSEKQTTVVYYQVDLTDWEIYTFELIDNYGRKQSTMFAQDGLDSHKPAFYNEKNFEISRLTGKTFYFRLDLLFYNRIANVNDIKVTKPGTNIADEIGLTLNEQSGVQIVTLTNYLPNKYVTITIPVVRQDGVLENYSITLDTRMPDIVFQKTNGVELEISQTDKYGWEFSVEQSTGLSFILTRNDLSGIAAALKFTDANGSEQNFPNVLDDDGFTVVKTFDQTGNYVLTISRKVNGQDGPKSVYTFEIVDPISSFFAVKDLNGKSLQASFVDLVSGGITYIQYFTKSTNFVIELKENYMLGFYTVSGWAKDSKGKILTKGTISNAAFYQDVANGIYRFQIKSLDGAPINFEKFVQIKIVNTIDSELKNGNAALSKNDTELLITDASGTVLSFTTNVATGNYISAYVYFRTLENLTKVYAPLSVTDNKLEIKLNEPGIFYIVFKDLAENVIVFGTGEATRGHLMISNVSKVTASIQDGSVGIMDGLVVTPGTTFTVDNFEKFTSVSINVVKDGVQVGTFTENEFTLDAAGAYEITTTGIVDTTEIQKTKYSMFVVSPESARLGFEYFVPNNYVITNVYQSAIGSDVKSIYSNFTSTKLGLSVNEGGNSHYTVFVTANHGGNRGSETFSFEITIAEGTPFIQSNVNFAETTTKTIVLSYNPHDIYLQQGSCKLIIKLRGSNSTAQSIDINAASEDSLQTYKINSEGIYDIQVWSETEETMFYWTSVGYKTPLNTVAIVLIVIGSAVAVVGVVLFIVLRTKMKVR